MSLGELSGALGGFQAGGLAGTVLGAGVGIMGGALGRAKQRADAHRMAADEWAAMRAEYAKLRAGIEDASRSALTALSGEYPHGAGLEGAINKPLRHKPSRTPELPRSKRKRWKR